MNGDRIYLWITTKSHPKPARQIGGNVLHTLNAWVRLWY